MLRLRDYKPGIDPSIKENCDDLYVFHQGDYRVVHVLGTERSGYIMSYFFDEDGLVQTLRITEDGAIEGCEDNVVAKHDDTITFADGSEILMSVDGICYYAVVGTDGSISLDIALMVREDGTGDVTENVGIVYPDYVRLLSKKNIKYFEGFVYGRCDYNAYFKYFAPRGAFFPFSDKIKVNDLVVADTDSGFTVQGSVKEIIGDGRIRFNFYVDESMDVYLDYTEKLRWVRPMGEDEIMVLLKELGKVESDNDLGYIVEDVLRFLREAGKKHKFKPFDKVLMRNRGVIPAKWFPVFFSHEENGVYYDTSGISFTECVSYEGNEALALTDREP